MSKYDDVLNELVYEIDDIVYDFYSNSNEIISRKKDRERLIEYRDQSLDTVNEMNIRSLELISDIKKKELVEERAVKLLEKNRDLVGSILVVLESAPNKSEIIDNISDFAHKTLESTKKAIKVVETSDAYEKIKDVAATSIDKAKDTIDNISHDERFIKSKEVIKDKTAEAVEFSAQVVKDGSRKLSDWLEERFEETEKKAEHAAEHAAEASADVVADVAEFGSDVVEEAADHVEEAVAAVEEEVETHLNPEPTTHPHYSGSVDDLERFNGE